MSEAGRTPAIAAAEPPLRERIVAFVRSASLEVTPHDGASLPQLMSLLPSRTVVYVTHTPQATALDVARLACEIEAAGLAACPHVVARRIGSERELGEALDALAAGGISRAMLVGGDVARPAGPFAAAADVLATGRLEAAGIRAIGIAGHPEGHPRVPDGTLWQALADKQAFAQRAGMRMHLVSQFVVDPGALVAWERALEAHGIGLPLHVGIAGPASLATLARYAVLCGVMRSLAAAGEAVRRIQPPERMLPAIVERLPGALARRVAQPHFFCFGGAVRTARWLAALREGRFELDERGPVPEIRA